MLANKEIGISLCDASIMVGDKITITPIDNNKTDIEVIGLFRKPFGSPVKSDDLKFLADGCGGKFTCGELLVVFTDATKKITKFTCQKPPNVKCYKKAKASK